MSERLDVTAPEVQRALADLREALLKLCKHAGNPSTRTLSDRMGKKYSHSTVATTLQCSRPVQWRVLEAVVLAMGEDPEQLRELWTATHAPTDTVPDHMSNLDDGSLKREFRVTASSEGRRYTVAELTENGLVPVISDLERWQALAVVSILDPPFSV